jgi:hypothetical protein
MALTCPTDLSAVNLGFDQFIDCSTLNINYDVLGTATLSFSVISVEQQPTDTQQYTDLTFGGVRFTGFISAIEVKKIPGTLVYQHNYTITAVGCR